MREKFTSAVKANQTSFGLDLSDDVIEKLADYYDLVQQHNPILHLVGPCSAEEFATRHILESLTLLEYLPENARLADVGTGGGLPSIPSLIARDDLHALLIESKEKKTEFLKTAVETLRLTGRADVVNKQFEEVKGPEFDHVTCRALDRFTGQLARITKWSRGRQMLLYGGDAMRDALKSNRLAFTEKLMPLSERRYLFVVRRR